MPSQVVIKCLMLVAEGGAIPGTKVEVCNRDPAYSGPDHLHPNLLGYRVMADAVPLSMLES